MNDSIWKRWTLLACLTLLASGQVAGYALFVARSTDFITRNHNARAVVYSAAHPLALPAQLRFGTNAADTRRLGDGWNLPEHEGVWSMANDAWIALAVSGGDAGVVLRLETSVYLSEKTPDNRIEVGVDGTTLGAAPRTRANADQPIEMRIPRAIANSGMLTLKLHVEHCVAPLREGTGAEPRRIGILLKSIELLPDEVR